MIHFEKRSEHFRSGLHNLYTEACCWPVSSLFSKAATTNCWPHSAFYFALVSHILSGGEKKYNQYISQRLSLVNLSSNTPEWSPSLLGFPLPPVVLHRGELWVGKCDGCHSCQRRHLSDHRRARAEQRSRPQHPEPHALLWHVWLLGTVCLPCESLGAVGPVA